MSQDVHTAIGTIFGKAPLITAAGGAVVTPRARRLRRTAGTQAEKRHVLSDGGLTAE